MAASMPALGGGVATLAAPVSFVLDARAQAAAGVITPSTYISDTSQQAPPAIG
jgi:hypothetical protein